MERMKESFPDFNFEHRSENLPDNDKNKTLSQDLSLPPGTFPNEDSTVRSEEAENGYGSEPQAPRKEKVIFDPEFASINQKDKEKGRSGLRPISTLKLTEKATAQFRAKVQAGKDDKIEEEKARFAMDEEYALFADPGSSTYEEAISGPEVVQRKVEIAEELQAMAENDVWDIVHLADEGRDIKKKIVGCRWVFVRKIRPDGFVERYKARLVAQGFSQIPGVDYFETLSPVIRYESVGALTAHATHN
jgi:hypothetical protein